MAHPKATYLLPFGVVAKKPSYCSTAGTKLTCLKTGMIHPESLAKAANVFNKGFTIEKVNADFKKGGVRTTSFGVTFDEKKYEDSDINYGLAVIAEIASR
jgi:hypothetical protein